MEKIENTSNLKIMTTDSIKDSYFEKVRESIEEGNDPKETFKLECETVAEIQRNIIDSFGVICNCDVGYIVVALKSLAASLENKKESDPIQEFIKTIQIRDLEKAMNIMTIQ